MGMFRFSTWLKWLNKFFFFFFFFPDGIYYKTISRDSKYVPEEVSEKWEKYVKFLVIILLMLMKSAYFIN